MADAHQWVYRYPAPLVNGQTINQVRPGEQIANAITEIQNVITRLQGGDGSGSDFDLLPDGTEVSQVLTWNGTAWVADFVRATA